MLRFRPAPTHSRTSSSLFAVLPNCDRYLAGHMADNPSSKIEFALRFATALHRYGTPAHRLEDAMTVLSEVLGLEGQFFVTPTAIFASFRTDGNNETRMLRVSSSELDLGKLSDLDALIGELAQHRIDVAGAQRRIDTILAQSPPYGRILSTLCYALTCACAARFFGGGAHEVIATLVISLGIGLGELLVSFSRRLSTLYAPLAATVVAFLATWVATNWSPTSAYIITLGSLITMMPGLTLTVGMKELATGHLASGTARLAGAFVVFATMGFGVAFGTRIGSYLFGSPTFVDPLMLPQWTEFAALLIAPFALAVEMRAHRRFTLWILGGCVLAFAASRLGSNMLGTELGVFAGATMLGFGSNIFSRITLRPSAIVLIPGMIMLVPGGMGFRGLSALLRGDVVSGVETLFLVTIVAIALVTGLLVANTLVPPRKAL